MNWEDIPESRRKVLAAQHHASLNKVVPSSASSAASTLTSTSSPGLIRRGNVTLHQDVVILSTQSSKPQIPIAIHSPMPHLTLQTGTRNEEQDCPGLRCMLDTGASLSTANFGGSGEAVSSDLEGDLSPGGLCCDHSVWDRYLLCGGTNHHQLSVGFEIHLPYVTKDGNDTSLLVAAGPDVAVNLILGLSFIKATGMIVDFIDNICDAKHLICNPFPIDFCCATKSIPVVGDRDAGSHSVKFHEVLCALGSIKAYFAANASGITPSGNPATSHTRVITPSIGAPANVPFNLNRRWVPPSKSVNDTNNYVHHVLGDMGYL